ncbi:tRNA threonylcarbamoyladenosine dehydratase [Ruminococcus gauvreauii]|uniref:tRNA threonylcarbamoyladenosine dehydratase n=1 Tax=Ruminococcus gauvreauii TaxID=438033 RepID=A0ABY5VIZ8_9FIRM|nr:tRNA threonylcarbamoyladenosine dehydratase [Ruminococcus gauvreauii]UWP60277.1 tRNA threonylcarbamoyladenosine dehydratase [Ruminococcus gauvreauii]
MQQELSRTEVLIGSEGVRQLGRMRVAVFGLGGVGSYAVEALARCGIGSLTLVDHDVISATNINRQLFALHSTIGKLKTEVAKDRVRDIDPDMLVHTYQTFYNEETAGLFDLESFDYIVDAIDTVTSKLLLIENAKRAGTPIICSMGTGNKLDPGRFEITDISKTSVCPLAKVMRQELRKRRIKKVKVLYSKEIPVKRRTDTNEKKGSTSHPVPGSISFVPSAAGLMLAGEVIRDLLSQKSIK